MSKYRQVGLLLNGIEFIPLDIVRAHMPFAAPPDMVIEAVYVDDDPPCEEAAACEWCDGAGCVVCRGPRTETVAVTGGRL